MIAFKYLGKMGRLGNQLFQYAFLRTQAEKKGVEFYCPEWIGDEIFNLQDSKIRARNAGDIKLVYHEPSAKDYRRDNLVIRDYADVRGNFESEKNFDSVNVRSWYRFQTNAIIKVKEKYRSMDFADSVGLHLRFGDKLNNKVLNKLYFTPRIEYYAAALQRVRPHKLAIVFSDDIMYAKRFLKGIDEDFVFIEGNKDWEDLYLMTRCKDFICGASTMSWWGAWLNDNPKKVVIFPEEGTYRPGSPMKNSDYIPRGAIKIRSLRPIMDNYLVVGFPTYNISYFLVRYIGFIGRRLKSSYPMIYHD